MVDAEATTLTDRQVEVLELRERGHTQREVADRLGTTDSNVSAIERAAEENVEKARRTLELVQTIRAPVHTTLPEGSYFEDVVDEIYDRGDEAGIKIDYCRPELYSHLFGLLEPHTSENRLDTSIRIGITEGGEVELFTEMP